MTPGDLKNLYDLADSISRQLSGLMKYLKNTGMKERKY